MASGGTRLGSGRKADPNSKRGQARARKGASPALPPPAKDEPKTRAPRGGKLPDAPAGWPFGTTEPPPEVADEVVDPTLSPLDFALKVMRDPAVPLATRLAAMAQALPYCHTKKGEGGKKSGQEVAAKTTATGRFGPGAPPRLVASRLTSI